MIKHLLIVGFMMVGFTQLAHAARERVTNCPPEAGLKKGSMTFRGAIDYDGNKWNVSLKGFTEAKVWQFLPNPAELVCAYGKSMLSVQVPLQFSGRTCSFDQASVEPTTECNATDPGQCVVYCEKRK